MIKINSERILKIAVKIGEKLLENGAEILRTEDSVRRIVKTYGVKSVDIYAVPSTIIVTITDENDRNFTKIKEVVQLEFDLNKVEKLNNLSRFICKYRPNASVIEEELSKILQEKKYKEWVFFTSYFFIPLVFSLFFGGNIFDGFFSGLAGIIVKIELDLLLKLKTNVIFTNAIASFSATIFAMLVYTFADFIQFDKVIIGAVMLLVPGLVITNSMRDFISGDLMTGVFRLVEAVLIASGIAFGVIFGLSLFNLKGSIG